MFTQFLVLLTSSLGRKSAEVATALIRNGLFLHFHGWPEKLEPAAFNSISSTQRETFGGTLSMV